MLKSSIFDKQESCAIANMTARCDDKSKQTATPPAKITRLSVELTQFNQTLWT